MPAETINNSFVVGEVSLWDIGPTGRRLLFTLPNLYMYGGADVAAKVVSGQANYKLGAMYLEFENQAVPGPITPPVYTRADGIDYYTALSGVRDYLRIPLTITPTYETSDAVKYDSNVVSFFAVSAGLVGMHGLPFDTASGSAVFGGALVATPDISIPANDLVWSRAYWADRAEYKQPNHQIGIHWTLRFL